MNPPYLPLLIVWIPCLTLFHFSPYPCFLLSIIKYSASFLWNAVMLDWVVVWNGKHLWWFSFWQFSCYEHYYAISSQWQRLLWWDGRESLICLILLSKSRCASPWTSFPPPTVCQLRPNEWRLVLPLWKGFSLNKCFSFLYPSRLTYGGRASSW